MTPVRLEPAAPRSRVKHSTTKPLHSQDLALLYPACMEIIMTNYKDKYKFWKLLPLLRKSTCTCITKKVAKSILINKWFVCMGGSRKFCQRGLIFSGLRDRGSKYPYKWAIIDPPAKSHWNGACWQADGSPTLNAGLVVCGFTGDSAQYCLEILYFCVFQGGSGPLPPPPLDPRMVWNRKGIK